MTMDLLSPLRIEQHRRPLLEHPGGGGESSDPEEREQGQGIGRAALQPSASGSSSSSEEEPIRSRQWRCLESIQDIATEGNPDRWPEMEALIFSVVEPLTRAERPEGPPVGTQTKNADSSESGLQKVCGDKASV